MASLAPLQQGEKSLQALAVVLQHPTVAADQRNICTLLQVSKAWRAVVQQLQLRWRGTTDTTGIHVNLQHVTSIQHLQLKAWKPTAELSSPVNLKSLNLRAKWPADRIAGLSSLQQLTAVRLDNSNASRGHLEALQYLPRLRNLSLVLRYSRSDELPLEMAAVWHSLPLCSLDIHVSAMTTTVLQPLIQHVATATTLTKLELSIPEVYVDGDRLAVCEQLQALKHLSSLSMLIDFDHAFAEHDAQHLSALTTLTNLELATEGFGPGVDVTLMCLLAVSLTRLRVLAIGEGACEWGHEPVFSALPAIGKLTTLEDLRLQSFPDEYEAQRGLRFMTGLSRLTTLGGFCNAGEAALQEFRAIIPGLQQKHCW